MNTTPLPATNPPETKPPQKSFWCRPVARWQKWYIFWAVLSAIVIGAACSYAFNRHSVNLARFIFPVLLTASFPMSLAALVKVLTKER